MAQVIIRNLDDAVVEALKRFAASENVSLEQKLRDILGEAATRQATAFWETADRMRAQTDGFGEENEALLWAARDERDGR